MPDYKMRPDKLEVRVNSPLAKTCMIRAGTEGTVNAVGLSWNIEKYVPLYVGLLTNFI